MDQGKLDQLGDPIWSSANYDLTFEIDDKNRREINLTIPFGNNSKPAEFYSHTYKDNATIFLHFQMMTPDLFSEEYKEGVDPSEQDSKLYRKSIPLIKYMKQIKESDTINLMEQMSDVPIAKKQSKEEEEEDHYYPHWKHHIDINLLCDNALYNISGAIPSEISKQLRGKIDWKTRTY